jgi:AraC-like DNA-binding protein
MISDHLLQKYRRRDNSQNSLFSPSEEWVGMPLSVSVCGNARWMGTRSYHRRNSEVFSVEYITSGDLSLIQNGKEYHVRSGEVFLLHQGSNHEYRVGPMGFHQKRYLCIEGLLRESLLRVTGLDTVTHIQPRNPSKVNNAMKEIFSEMQRRSDSYRDRVSRLIYGLLVELGQSTTVSLPTPLLRALDFMQAHLNRPLTSKEICDAAGLSMTHFNRLFRAHFNTSPLHYFYRQRMAWAKHLLLQTPLSVKQIAFTVGYEEPLYFSAQFKKAFGLSPRNFRKESLMIGVFK